jgi:DHA1 family inner membrane transport protein
VTAIIPARAAWPALPAAVVAFATAVVVATEFIVVGLLPAMSRGLGITLTEAGHFVSAFALGSAVFGPLLIIPAARWEPRIVMAVALIPFALGNLAAAVMPGYGVVLAMRILQGAALPVLVSVGSAAVAGTVVAMPAGTVLADTIDWRISFLLLGGMALVAAWSLMVAFPRKDAWRSTAVRDQVSILSRPILWAQLLLSAVLFAAMFAPYTYLAALLENVGGLDATGIAVMLAWFGLAGIPGNMVAGRLSERGPIQATFGVALVLAVVMPASAFAGNGLMALLPLLAIWGAAHAAAFLLSQIRVMHSAPTAPAFAAALNISAANIGIAAGAAVGGAIVERASIAASSIGGMALALAALMLATALHRIGER